MENYLNRIDRIGRRKLYIICIVIFMLINIAIALYMNDQAKIIHVDGEAYKLIEQTPISMLFESEDHEIIVNTKDVSSWSIGLLGKVDITYLGETYTYRKHKYDGDLLITFESGEEITKVYDIYASTYIPVSKETFLLKTIEGYKKTKSPSIFMMYPLIMNILGLGLIFYPKEFWKLHVMFIVSGGEPTDYAIWSNVISGIAIVLIFNIFFWSFI